MTETASRPALAEDEAGLPGPSIGEAVVDLRGGRRPFRALGHREFRLLFAAYALGDIGFWISHISLQSEMARITDSSSLWLGLLFFTTFIPMLIVAPIAGVVADRVDRKAMLVASRGAVAVVASALAVVVLSDLGSPGVLAAFGMVLGTLFAFMAPAQQAATANSVPADDLTSAIAVQSAGNNLARIGGPALAAPILAAWGAGPAFAVYAASNALMILTLLPIRLTRQLEDDEPGGIWERWKGGLRHARDRPPALWVLATMSVFSVFGVAYVALFPVFTTDVLHHPRDDFTLLVVASGVGAVVGALATGFRRTIPSLRTSAIWLGAFGLATSGFALSRSWTLSLAINGAVGFCYFSTTTSMNTLLQHLADDEKRGRMMGLFTLTWAGLIPFGGIWMGALADAEGAPLTVSIGAGICTVFAGFILLRRSERSDRSSPGSERPRAG